MSSTTARAEIGGPAELHYTISSNEIGVAMSSCIKSPQFKRRKTVCNPNGPQHQFESNVKMLPVLKSSEYYMKPPISELVDRELVEKNYSSRVRDFIVGRVGYGHVKFLGETDVRCLDLERIITFQRHEVIVYGDESNKPAIGQGLNKAAEVTLILQIGLPFSDRLKLDKLVKLLRSSTERQGAHFISFNASSGEWKFSVRHFSRFGLTEEDEDDITMDDAVLQEPSGPSGDELEIDAENEISPDETILSHSLPSHLGLNPAKMQELRMMMFPVEEEEELVSSGKEYMRSNGSSNAKNFHKQVYSLRARDKSRMSPVRKSPQALLEYTNSSDLGPQRNILMTGQNKGLPIRTTKVESFKFNMNHDIPIANSHSSNIVDAALFMGRSFRVGWGPNGTLFHTGTPTHNSGSESGLSSIIHIEKVAIDRSVRDENGKVKDELVELCFSSPLNLHKSLNHRITDVVVGSSELKLQKVVSSCQKLPEICHGYTELIEKQLDVSGLSRSTRLLSIHQVMIWELIKVLFSEKESSSRLKPLDGDADDEEDMMDDGNDGLPDMDLEAYPLVRRADFSEWLQESVCHHVQEEVSSLNESNDLEHIFLLLSGRQLDSAVELAASRGDVRMACLLSQAGGSMVSRSDMASQLEIWRANGLDFNFIENDRVRLYELLAGNIHGAIQDSEIDWKRYLGLLMWYQLAPDTSLPVIILTYQQLLNEGRAPYPVPIYVDEGPHEGAPEWSPGDHFDIAYYLMLLHAERRKDHMFLSTMFSAFSSTYDPLDYHMIWHQRALLEAIGIFSSKDLHILDMSLVSQLLCLGLCHWAIYVALHIPYRDDFHYLHSNVIREILFQYCETWSTDEVQRKFIEDLGVPSEWLHEALAVYYEYYRDVAKALEHCLKSFKWQKAHLIFMTSVVHLLFSSSDHSEVWRLATSMEEHKTEIANWDLGAGIYIDFYLLKNSLQAENTISKVGSLESKSDACRLFIERLNESLSVWGNKLPVETRYTYSKMAEELFSLLASERWEDSTREGQLGCFDTMLMAPIAEDRRSCHLQDAVSVFTYFLSESASY